MDSPVSGGRWRGVVAFAVVGIAAAVSARVSVATGARPTVASVVVSLAPGVAKRTPRLLQDSQAPNGLAGVAKRMAGGKGAGKGGAAGSGGTRFSPSGRRVFVAKMVDTLTEGEGAEAKKALTELFEKSLDVFDVEAKKAGLPNDITPALAFYIQTCWEVATGKSAPEAGGDALVVQIRSVLDGPEVEALSDEAKQSLYEYWVCSAALTLTLQEIAKQSGPDAVANLKKQASAALKGVLGVDASQVSITATGLTFPGMEKGAAKAAAKAAAEPGRTGGLPAGAGAAKVAFTAPADSKVETQGGTSFIHRPAYDGYTKNAVEQLYYAVLPSVASSSQPDREAAFETAWTALTASLNIKWVDRTLIHRYTLASGATCYVAIAGIKYNETYSGYGPSDYDRMTLCLLDFGPYLVPVAQVYRVRQGYDNEFRLSGPLDGFVNSIRVAGVSTPSPKPHVTREQVIGAWSHSDGYSSTTNYYYASSGNFAGSQTNASSSQAALTFNADGTCRYYFFWWYNGTIRTDDWKGKWTFNKGTITMTNPADGKPRSYTAVYAGKHPKSGERFVALYYQYTRESTLTPISSHSSDTKVYTPLKK